MSYITEFTKWSTDRNIQLTNEMNGFSVGESIVYTNENGVWFVRDVFGFDLNPSESLPDRVVYLDKDSYWFPVKFSEIKKFTEFVDEMMLKYQLSNEDVKDIINKSEESGFDYFSLFYKEKK